MKGDDYGFSISYSRKDYGKFDQARSQLNSFYALTLGTFMSHDGSGQRLWPLKLDYYNIS